MDDRRVFKVLQPKYYSRFQCDPVKCRESCCERWEIIIDKNTYEKYIQSEKAVIQGVVKTGLSINETAVGDEDFAIINLNKEMMCPFLNEDNLCQVFIHMGEESLSKTCKSYPRAILQVKDVLERGLEMSCSVAAELALLNEKGIEFEYVMDQIKLNDVYVVTPAIEDWEQAEILMEIRAAMIRFLQNRAMGLEERIELIGYFLNHILGSIDSGSLYQEALRSGMEKAAWAMEQGEFKRLKKDDPLLSSQQFHHLNTILSMKFQEGDSIRFFSKRYIDCLMQVLDAFGRIKAKELEKRFKNSNEKFLKPYLDKKSYILENFLVNYVFIYGIESFTMNELWTSYLKLCMVYGLLKFNLVGLAAYHKGMNDDLMLKLIQSLSKTIITDKKYLESAIRYLEEERLIEFSKLITLVVD